MKISDLKKGYAGLNAGVWVGDIPLPLFDGIRLKTRRLWNEAYRDLHDEMSAETTDLSAEDNEFRITTECLLQTCLVDWEGVDDAFSVDTARLLINDPDVGGAFRTAVLYAAGHVADTIKAQLEADEKN